MRSYVRLITTPTSDTAGTALYLQFDDRRYIIGNAHEGLHRATLQTKTRVLKTKDILLTGKTEWQSKGGLLGLILTIADVTISSAGSKEETARQRLEKMKNREREEERRKKNKPNLDGNLDTTLSFSRPTRAELDAMMEDPTVRLHGGPNLTHMIATARSFIYRKGTPIKVLEHIEERKAVEEAEQDWKPTWSDHRIQVWAMPIKPSIVSQVKLDTKPVSPRKRSLGDFMSGERPSNAEILSQWRGRAASPETQNEQDQRTRELAVSEMFSSEWSRESLVQVPLRDVEMPATIFVLDPVTKVPVIYEGPTPGGTAPVPDIDVLVRQPWPGALIDRLPPTKPSQTSMSYIIRNHKMRGKFNAAVADELGVPSGILRAALAAGSPVQSSNGLTVTPDMVLSPSREGPGVAVIDLPSKDYLRNLINRPEWSAERVMCGVVAVIWILGPGVVQDKSFIEFVESKPGLQHIISSPEHCPNYLPMTSAASMAICHNQIDPARYAIPIHSNAVSSSSDASEAETKMSEQLPKNCQPARSGLTVNLEPKSGITEEAITPYLDTASVAQKTSQIVLDLSKAARQEIDTPAVQAETLAQNLPSPDAEVICLGTGSASPSPYRNVAATLLRVPGCGSYLIDCGENTLGQLKRMYTAPQLAELFHDLKLIWISHLHADHHLGLASVIKAWYEEVHGADVVKRRKPTISEQTLDTARLLMDGKRLFIVGQSKMMRWLNEYSSVEDFGYDQLVPLVSFPNLDHETCNLEWNGTNVGFHVSGDSNMYVQIPLFPKVAHTDIHSNSAIREATGLSNLVSCYVSHCWGSQAVSMTFPTGFKFSYSGDCRPSRWFASIGRDSTVLVHEATFDDDLKSEAMAKKHSTTSEAIGIGAAMGARRVILTHFSQRYQKIPSLNAFDTRSIKLEDAEDIDYSSANLEQPVDESILPPATTDESSETLDDTPSQAQPRLQPEDVNQPVQLSSTTDSLAQETAPSVDSAPRPLPNDMRIGVAFDGMRVKVGDIIHLDKFTPALIELYKDSEDQEDKGGNEKAAKEAFSDNENDILRQGQPRSVKNINKRSAEEQAERARKGQMKAAKRAAKRLEESQKAKVMEKREDDEKYTAGEGMMEGVEVTEPVEDKMKVAQ